MPYPKSVGGVSTGRKSFAKHMKHDGSKVFKKSMPSKGNRRK